MFGAVTRETQHLLSYTNTHTQGIPESFNATRVAGVATIKSIWEDFKHFIDKGNVFGLAVGVVTGAAFGKLLDSLVNDIITPPLGLLLGAANFENLFVVLKYPKGGPTNYNTIKLAQESGAVTWNLGLFIQNLCNFLIVSFAIYWMVRVLQIFNKEEIINTQVACKFCQEKIDKRALRCQHCTSWLNGKETGFEEE
ncbi:MscL-domain-containing protein [Basidiobolus meristosporus CBS 931.73]|uniref:MscL-domain-containing protein n=1 Tax=Basidiobolus meristosporus CBS 931.73 TaxID=1314790 RepID=A0A1Y1YNH5_9FUNG|nr:MscL-domain-containing protein [Basidiobolus meristosporus CBS 931.73]|eukprot:ORX99316.1 MscL-domain-containing protein [Basidiobolus meristosporus CBS 931.73]